MADSRLSVEEVPNLYSPRTSILDIINVELLGIFEYGDLKREYDPSLVPELLKFGQALIKGIKERELVLGVRRFERNVHSYRSQVFVPGFNLAVLDKTVADFILGPKDLEYGLRGEFQPSDGYFIDNREVTLHSNVARVTRAKIFN